LTAPIRGRPFGAAPTSTAATAASCAPCACSSLLLCLLQLAAKQAYASGG
jgi:hypothetical protein